MHNICACRHNTEKNRRALSYLHATLGPQACYESWMFTQPSILTYLAVGLHWSAPATKQNVYAFVLSCLFFFLCFLTGESKKGLIMLKIMGRGGSPPNSSSMKDSGHERKKKHHSLVSAASFFMASIHTHQVSRAFRHWSGWFTAILSLSRCVTLCKCGELKMKPWKP